MAAVLQLAPDRRPDVVVQDGAPSGQQAHPTTPDHDAVGAMSEVGPKPLFERLRTKDSAVRAQARVELDALVEERLVALAERTLEGRGDARTVVREAVERVLREKLPTLREPSLKILCAYLRTVVTMRARQISMRERRRRELREEHPEAPGLRSTAAGCGYATPEEELLDKEQKVRMHGCMSKLSERDQRLVEMRSFEGADWKTITDEMNQRFPRTEGKLAGKPRSEKTVQRMYAQVLAALRSCMEGV